MILGRAILAGAGSKSQAVAASCAEGFLGKHRKARCAVPLPMPSFSEILSQNLNQWVGGALLFLMSEHGHEAGKRADDGNENAAKRQKYPRHPERLHFKASRFCFIN